MINHQWGKEEWGWSGTLQNGQGLPKPRGCKHGCQGEAKVQVGIDSAECKQRGDENRIANTPGWEQALRIWA